MTTNDASPQLGVTPAGAHVASDLTKEDLLAHFEHEWYIHIKFQITGPSALDRHERNVEMQAGVRVVFEDIKSLLFPDKAVLWPRQLVDGSAERNVKTQLCSWLIGFPSITPSKLPQARKITRDWQDTMAQDSQWEARGIKSTAEAKFMPRKVFLQHDFGIDENALSEKATDTLPTRSGNNFKKAKGSNPRQVRQQFLQHAMGQDTDEAETRKMSVRLRSVKDVLKRLRYDSSYNVEDYVIGYIDRKAGILEKPVSEWQDFDQEDLVAYFKNLPQDLIVWDRARKLDWIFNPRPAR
ncbi:hypothetical protein GQ53DRAFT_809881 [Thozetella sp. PMI_491]|nr:hypothetical protein GQ53DRAFT_809881 [Thozetella sp. PMI_491]